VKLSTPILAVIGIYQFARFLALGLAVLLRTPLVEEVLLRHAVISLAAGGLVPIVLLIQYMLERQRVLLTPLRLAKFLELLAVFMVFPAVFPNLYQITRDPLGGIMSILVLTDTVVFLFLLLLPGKDL
jgi:hypothetical protein